MKPVLAFLILSTNTSLGLFWTLVQVLLHTNLIQLSTSCSPPPGWAYVPSGKSTCIHAYALVYGEGGRIATKPTLVGHIPPNINIFSQKLLGWCDDKQNTTLMVIVCTSKQFRLLNFTKQQGGVIKVQKQNRHMISKFNTLVPISLINYLKQAFLP
jgi:hypothetical protein